MSTEKTKVHCINDDREYYRNLSDIGIGTYFKGTINDQVGYKTYVKTYQGTVCLEDPFKTWEPGNTSKVSEYKYIPVIEFKY